MSSNRTPGVLTHARYGKDKVRVLRVVREPGSKVHHIVEYNVTVLLEGDIDTRCVRSHLDSVQHDPTYFYCTAQLYTGR